MKSVELASKHTRVARALFVFLTAFALSSVALGASLPRPGALSPTNPLMMPQGGGAPTASGDYVAAGAGLNTFYSYYVEVPAGATRLVVDMFDADVGNGDSANGAEQRDRQRGGSWNTTFAYRLFNPAGAAVGTNFGAGTGAAPVGADNAWLTFFDSVTAPAAGHWRVEVDGSASGEQDINGLGLRAHDGTSGAGGTEYPVYAERFIPFGAHDPDGTAGNNSATHTLYPYVTSACVARSHDFDMDSGAAGDQGQIALTDRSGGSVLNSDDATLSINDVWNNDNTSAIDTNQFQNTDHGIWTGTSTITDYAGGNSNYKVWWLTDGTAGDPPAGGNAPTTTTPASGYRIYFPTDAGGVPVKPYLQQQLTYFSGTNPPANPGTTTLQITVRVVNTTIHAITFSGANLVTANVPGGTVTYTLGASALASQGTITAQPATGGSGNVTWNPGTLAAGTTAIMTYRVNITNPAAGNTFVTGQPPASGTRAQWLDETGNAAQARATFLFGPLCGVFVTSGAAITYASIASVRAYPDSNGTRVEWETSGEAGTAGWILRRQNPVNGDFERVHDGQIPALLTDAGGGVYSVVDTGAASGGAYRYSLTEIQTNGARHQYGPYSVAVGGLPANLSEPKQYGMFNNDNGQANEAITRNASVKSGLRQQQRQSHQKSQALTQTTQYTRQAKAGRSGVTGTLAKLAVTQDGAYYLSAAEIAAKLSVSESRARQWIRKGNILITNRGGSVRYLPKFKDDGLYFYGEAINSPYTSENIYWVSEGSGDIDMRMSVVTRPGPGAGSAGQVFTDNLRAETDLFAGSVVPVSPGQDFWYWKALWTGASTDFIVPSPGAARTGTATLRMHVQGATSTPSLLDHQATVRVNGVVVGSGQWDDLATHTVNTSFDQAILGEANTVTVSAAGDPGSIYYINSFELSYQRRMTAIGDRLTLHAGAQSTIVVDGFSNDQLAVLDISNPQSPTLLLSARIEAAAGGYQARFTPSTTPGGRYLAISATQALSPLWFASEEASSLRASSNQADYLVIAPDELKASANKLAAYRSGSGMSTRVVMLDDIYNEFNHGIVDPQAIKAFLAHAYSGWTRAPRYVALLGKGTFDYKDVGQYGTNLLPPLMASTVEGMYACDTCYADTTGDGVPEFAIGRIPVTSNTEFDQYYAKLTASEASGGARATQVLFAADAQDPPANFTTDANALAARVPGGFNISNVYLDSPPPPSNDLNSARSALQVLLNGTGASMFAYVGHGGMDRLAKGGLLTVGDVGTTLTNGGKMPVLTALSCLINRFEVPGVTPALGETLIVNPQGGASAVWAPTGTSNDANARILGEKLFEAVYSKNIGRIGDAIVDAMTTFRSGQNAAAQELQVYTLLGDPAAVIPGRSGGVVRGPSNSVSGGTSSSGRE